METSEKIKFLYHPKQGLFHFADEDESIRKEFGWCYLGILPDNLACDFTEYAEKNILNKDKIISYEIMRDEYLKWLHEI